MKPMLVSVDEFDLDGFIAANLVFLRQFCVEDVPPEAGVAFVDETGFPEWPDPNAPPPNLRQAIESGHLAFFSFHSRYVGDTIQCVDGSTIEPPPWEDGEGNPSPQYESWMEGVPGEDSAYGFAVSQEADRITIVPALSVDGACTAPPASVEPVDDCGVFGDLMRAFCERFIKQ